MNRYDVITLNPAEHDKAAQEPARRFADWLVSPVGQKTIASFTVAGERPFHPVADPEPDGAISR